MICLKIHRIIKTYFGNYRNFVAWGVAVFIAVFTIDQMIFPRITHPKSRKVNSEDYEPTTRTIVEDIKEEEGGEEGGGGGGEEDGAKQEQQQQPPSSSSGSHDDKRLLSHAAHCGLTAACPKGKFSYFVRSGYGKDASATVCFNENYIMAEDKVNSGRGMNMVVIDDITLKVVEIKVFDVFTSDVSLMSYLQNNIKDEHIVIVASHDEASFNLSAAARSEFHKFGSSILDQVNFRDNYAIVGQRGIAMGQALETIQPRKEDMQFAENAVIGGCMTIPVGQLKGGEEEKEKEKESERAKDKDIKDDKRPSNGAAKDTDKDASQQQQKQKKKTEAETPPPPSPPKPKEKEEEKKREEAGQREEEGGGGIKLGEAVLNCGMRAACPGSSIAVHLYTGLQASALPRICVDGKYVISDGLNDAGRGLNFVVFDPESKKVVRVSRFDTYGSADDTLELFLEMLDEGELLLAVAHDEASMKLKKSIRASLEALGSSYISLLSFRDVWAFVGQKGINGFSPYEELEFSDANSDRQILTWPDSIDIRLCVPPKLKSLTAKRVRVRNLIRRNFCQKHEGYGDFCSKENFDKPLLPAPPVDKSLANDPIFSIPIVIIAGLDFNGLRRQLENLLSNPGIKVEMVKIFYDEKFSEADGLSSVFNMTSHKLDSSIKYAELMQKAIEVSWKQFPNTKYLIILEEEVFPSSDFLNFFRQCLPAVEADDTLAGISAWNDNAYRGRAGASGLAYRVETLPGLGFLLKKSFYEKHLKGRMNDCCMRRSWEGWSVEEGDDGDFEMIIPDLSRVDRGQYNGRMTPLLKELFSRPRESVEFEGKLYQVSNADSLSSETYETRLKEVISKSRSLDHEELQNCLDDDKAVYPMETITDGSYVVFYKQETSDDDSLLSALCRCFNLFHVPNYKVRGTHRGLVRFSHGEHPVLLIGSESSYFSQKPKTANVLQRQTKD